MQHRCSRHLDDLDDPVLLHVFSFLQPLPDLFNVAASCRVSKAVPVGAADGDGPALWRVLAAAATAARRCLPPASADICPPPAPCPACSASATLPSIAAPGSTSLTALTEPPLLPPLAAPLPARGRGSWQRQARLVLRMAAAAAAAARTGTAASLPAWRLQWLPAGRETQSS